MGHKDYYIGKNIMTERGRKNCNYANNVIYPQTEQHVCVLGMLPLVPQNYGCQEQGAENF